MSNFTKCVKGLAALLATGALLASNVGAAQGQPAALEEPYAALELLSMAAPDKSSAVLEDLASVTSSANGEDAINSVVGGSRVVVPNDPADGIILESVESGEGFTIGLPFAADAKDATEVARGIIAYDNLNGSTTIPLVKNDGSVQITTVIDGPMSPSRFDYALNLPKGAELSITETGGVIFLSPEGEFLGGFAPAWAYDANGKAVPTKFELQGTTVTQIVDHNESFSYPVVADPWGGQNLVSWANVTYHGSYYKVNAAPTSWGLHANATSVMPYHVTELKYRLGGNAWRVDTNGGTIREQFLCHVAGNIFVPDNLYNMESYQPARLWNLQLNPIDRCNILKDAP